MEPTSLSARDRRVVWHPYTQAQTAPPPLPVVAGKGAWLELEDGSRLLDMVSSWWLTLHGHAEPTIAAAIAAQAATLEQVIFAGCTHPQAVRLAERLLHMAGPHMARVFFTDDGSTAVEVALKMAWQYWQARGEARGRIAALEGAYHGDTFGAMSVSGRSVFTRAFESLLFEVAHVPSPAVAPVAETLAALGQAHAETPLAALVVEPLVQGAGGMRMYSPRDLSAIGQWCREEGVLLIADEVMTGFHRTGTAFAFDQASTPPDIICLSKGLTGGFLPMATTLCTAAIHDAFLSDDRARMLFHGHSFTGNPLGCAAANASLDLLELHATQQGIARICAQQAAAAARLSSLSGLRDARSCGTILAVDLEGGGGYLQTGGAAVAAAMLQKGVLIRPLGNVLYLMPPYCTTAEELDHAHQALMDAILRL